MNYRRILISAILAIPPHCVYASHATKGLDGLAKLVQLVLFFVIGCYVLLVLLLLGNRRWKKPAVSVLCIFLCIPLFFVELTLLGTSLLTGLAGAAALAVPAVIAAKRWR